MDYSVYCFVDNGLGPALTLTDYGHSHGTWDIEPIDYIPENAPGFTYFRLNDQFGGIYGATGYVKYKTDDGAVFTFTFSDPTGNNDNSGTVTCEGDACSKYGCSIGLQSNCVPWTTTDGGLDTYWGFDNCEPYQGSSAVYGHPVCATLNVWYLAKVPKAES